MERERLVRIGTPAKVVAPWILVLCASCAPPPLTDAEAAAVLERGRFAGLTYTTYLNPMIQSGCLDRTRYLVHCENAGLVSVRWVHQDSICGEFAVDLTEKGKEVFTGLEYAGRRDLLYTTKGWQASLRQPIRARLLEVQAIEDLPEGRKRVVHTWDYQYPPILQGCTRHSQPEVYQDEAVLTPGLGRWKLEPVAYPRPPTPVTPPPAETR